ncbi:MAG: hypothetical protein ACREOW_04535 [Thermodesulfobacteriota bacterium]
MSQHNPFIENVIASETKRSNDKSLDPSVALLLQDDAMRQIATPDFVSLAMTDVTLECFTEFTLGNQKGLQRYSSYDRMKENLNASKLYNLKERRRKYHE